MALSDLTYENIMTIFAANTSMSCIEAHNAARYVIGLAKRNRDLNTHEGRVNFAKDSIEIRHAILDGHRIKAVKILQDQCNNGEWYFTLRDSRDAVYEAYGLLY